MENTTQPQPDITLADLEVIRNIIDVASSRGAFRGGELKDVGEVYNKLAAFITFMVAASQATTEAENTPDSAQTPQGE